MEGSSRNRPFLLPCLFVLLPCYVLTVTLVILSLTSEKGHRSVKKMSQRVQDRNAFSQERFCPESEQTKLLGAKPVGKAALRSAEYLADQGLSNLLPSWISTITRPKKGLGMVHYWETKAGETQPQITGQQGAPDYMYFLSSDRSPLFLSTVK